jgi:plastocyanin
VKLAYLRGVRWLPLVWLVPVVALAEGGAVEGTVTVKKDSGSGSVKNALVYIDGYRTPPPSKPAKMSQFGRAFQPVVLPVIQGGKVIFTNEEVDESIYHHVFSPTKKLKIDSDKYKPKAQYQSPELSYPGPFEVFCDIHREMISSIYVVPNDRFALLSTAEGTSAPFRIEGIKPGKVTLVGWHRSASKLTAVPIEIKEGQTLHVDLTIEGQVGVEALLETHKPINKPAYDPLKADGGSPGEMVGAEDKWK